MTITPEQLAQAFEYFENMQRGNTGSVEATPPSASDRASDFIPASLVYEHEKAHRQPQPQSINDLADVPKVSAAFTPIGSSDLSETVPQTSPDFVLTPMEADLKEVS